MEKNTIIFALIAFMIPTFLLSIGLYNAFKFKRENNLYSDYDIDEDGNLISCCGDILDADIMICPTCKEHN